MKIKQAIIASFLFSSLAGLNSSILPENIFWYGGLSPAEFDVLKETKNRMDLLKKICYLETRSCFFSTGPTDDKADPLLQEVATKFKEYFAYSFKALIGGILPEEDSTEEDSTVSYYLDGDTPKALILFWLIRKRIDLSLESLDSNTEDNMYDFRTYYKTMLRTMNKALKNLEKLKTDPDYSGLSDDERLKKAFELLVDKKEGYQDGEGCLDYPRLIVGLFYS